MTKIWDITVPYRTDLPLWPGDPAPSMTMMKCQAKGYRCNVTRLDAGVHFGTHLDAPVHFIDGDKGVDELDINVLVGPCVVAEIPDVMEITPDHLAALDLPPDTARLLLKTKNSVLWDRPTAGKNQNRNPTPYSLTDGKNSRRMQINSCARPVQSLRADFSWTLLRGQLILAVAYALDILQVR